MPICGCGRLAVCLLVIVPVPHSRSSLVRFSRRFAVVSYSILDDVMRITGSCGIRLVVYPACLPVVVSVPRAMWAAVSSRSSCRRTVRLSPLLA